MWWLSLLAAYAAPLPIEEIVRSALQHDPAVAHAMAELTIAEGTLTAAQGLRSNPRLDYRIGFGGSQQEASLTQPLSLSGEGTAAAQAAQRQVEAAQAALRRQNLLTAAAARAAVVRCVQADDQREIAVSSLDLARTLRATAEHRLDAGDGTQLEIQLARLDEAAAVADLLAATREVSASRSALSAITGLPATTELPADLWVAIPQAPPDSPPTGARSDIQAASLHQDAAQAALRQAEAAAIPPVEIGVWAQTSPGAWVVGPSVGWTLPVWKTESAARAQAQAALSMSAADLAAVTAQAEAERAAVPAQQAAIREVEGVADPTGTARAALSSIAQGLSGGWLSPADAALLRGKVLDAWRRAAGLQAAAALTTLEIAQTEEWESLIPD